MNNKFYVITGDKSIVGEPDTMYICDTFMGLYSSLDRAKGAIRSVIDILEDKCGENLKDVEFDDSASKHGAWVYRFTIEMPIKEGSISWHHVLVITSVTLDAGLDLTTFA